MRRFSRWISDFFGFSRSQTNAFIVLIPLMAITIFSEPVYRWWVSSRVPDHTRDSILLDSLISRWKKKEIGDGDTISQAFAPEAFDFDPNQASVNDLQRLGFSRSLSKRITHYRDKGGKFRIKSDLLKMYGMDTLRYHQLYDHILLPVTIHKELAVKKEFKFKTPERKTEERFDINTADSLQLEKIYGIGPALSKRIIKYRGKLGGFTSIDQLKEVWGLDTTAINNLTKHSFVARNYQPVQLNVNQATENELSVHPYLSRNIAKAIVAYRFQHGAFTALSDLRNIHALDINTIQKITPYLRLN